MPVYPFFIVGLGGGLTGVVGQSRNAAINITAASATATWTADEIVVETVLGGTQYRLNNLTLSVNLASIGVGGMDAGTAPVSGFVALYVIYNPVSGAKALLATNATAATASEIYDGAAMPSGYTASALVSVVPTNSSGQIIPLIQFGRETTIPQFTAVSTTAAPSTFTALSIASIVPKNAISCSGSQSATTSSSGQSVAGALSGSPNGSALGNRGFGGITQVTVPFIDLPLPTRQTIYWSMSTTGGTLTSTINITGYKI